MHTETEEVELSRIDIRGVVLKNIPANVEFRKSDCNEATVEVVGVYIDKYANLYPDMSTESQICVRQNVIDYLHGIGSLCTEDELVWIAKEDNLLPLE